MSVTTTGGGRSTIGIVSAFQELSPGILTQISLRANKRFQPLGEQFWSLHLGRGQTVDQGVEATLLAGYIQYPNALTWHGFLEIPSALFMIIEGVGVNGAVATGIDTRVTLTLDGKLTEYLINIQKSGRKT